MKKLLLILLSIVTTASFSACQTDTTADINEENAKDTVFVSILPQKYFVEQIVGDTLNVEVMVKPGFSPATYEPTTSQMLSLSNATAYFKIGVPFEKSWMDRISESNPNMDIVDTANGITLREMDSIKHLEAELEEEHEHNELDEDHEDHDEHMDENDHEVEDHDDHDHDHSGSDPHIWLSPDLVKIQADTISQSLISLYPENEELYTQNLAAFKANLDSLHNEIDQNLQDLEIREFLVFHPSWGYFADEFGLTQYAIEVEGKEPTVKELAQIIDFAKENNVKVIFVQEQFSKQNAESIAEDLDAKIVSIDPLAENYIENLIQIADTIKENLND